MKKDIFWTIKDIRYVIRNVPYIEADYDHEELLDLDTAVKLEMIGHLMVENEIPHDVDFDDIADLEF